MRRITRRTPPQEQHRAINVSVHLSTGTTVTFHSVRWKKGVNTVTVDFSPAIHSGAGLGSNFRGNDVTTLKSAALRQAQRHAPWPADWRWLAASTVAALILIPVGIYSYGLWGLVFATLPLVSFRWMKRGVKPDTRTVEGIMGVRMETALIQLDDVLRMISDVNYGVGTNTITIKRPAFFR